jgi:hypothetical protein
LGIFHGWHCGSHFYIYHFFAEFDWRNAGRLCDEVLRQIWIWNQVYHLNKVTGCEGDLEREIVKAFSPSL